jgi:hypothetical protein
MSTHHTLAGPRCSLKCLRAAGQRSFLILLISRHTVPLSTQQFVLLRLLARLDQRIADAEARLLKLLGSEDLHRAIDQVAGMQMLRVRIETEINNSRDA